MKKCLKTILIILFLLVFTYSLFYTANAEEGEEGTPPGESSYSSKMQELLKTAKDTDDSTNTVTSINNVTYTIITAVRIIGVCIAVVMLLTIAMKYMTAAPGEKADIKKSAVGYIVGAIVLFGVTGILGIINKFADNVNNTGN